MDPNFIIIVPADDLAPTSARSSAGTVMTIKLEMFSSKFLRLFIAIMEQRSETLVNTKGHHLS